MRRCRHPAHGRPRGLQSKPRDAQTTNNSTINPRECLGGQAPAAAARRGCGGAARIAVADAAASSCPHCVMHAILAAWAPRARLATQPVACMSENTGEQAISHRWRMRRGGGEEKKSSTRSRAALHKLTDIVAGAELQGARAIRRSEGQRFDDFSGAHMRTNQKLQLGRLDGVG